MLIMIVTVLIIRVLRFQRFGRIVPNLIAHFFAVRVPRFGRFIFDYLVFMMRIIYRVLANVVTAVFLFVSVAAGYLFGFLRETIRFINLVVTFVYVYFPVRWLNSIYLFIFNLVNRGPAIFLNSVNWPAFIGPDVNKIPWDNFKKIRYYVMLKSFAIFIKRTLLQCVLVETSLRWLPVLVDLFLLVDEQLGGFFREFWSLAISEERNIVIKIILTSVPLVFSIVYYVLMQLRLVYYYFFVLWQFINMFIHGHKVHIAATMPLSPQAYFTPWHNLWPQIDVRPTSVTNPVFLFNGLTETQVTSVFWCNWFQFWLTANPRTVDGSLWRYLLGMFSYKIAETNLLDRKQLHLASTAADHINVPVEVRIETAESVSDYIEVRKIIVHSDVWGIVSPVELYTRIRSNEYILSSWKQIKRGFVWRACVNLIKGFL